MKKILIILAIIIAQILGYGCKDPVSLDDKHLKTYVDEEGGSGEDSASTKFDIRDVRWDFSEGFVKVSEYGFTEWGAYANIASEVVKMDTSDGKKRLWIDMTVENDLPEEVNANRSDFVSSFRIKADSLKIGSVYMPGSGNNQNPVLKAELYVKDVNADKVYYHDNEDFNLFFETKESREGFIAGYILINLNRKLDYETKQFQAIFEFEY